MRVMASKKQHAVTLAISFLRFLIVGVINTSVSLGVIIIFMSVLQIDYRIANLAGYLVGSCVSFLLNRQWTFRADGPWIGSILRWAGIVGVSYLVNFVVVVTAVTRLDIRADLAQLLGMAAYTMSAFVGGRFFAFRPREAPRAEASIA